MAWIRTLEELEQPPGGLQLRLAPFRDPGTGRLDEILAVHGQDPEGLEAHLALYVSSMRGTEGLSVLDRELIALTVSRLNGCHY